jgi:hypothetical protein
MSAKVGSLQIDLGLNSANLSSGLRRAEREVSSSASGMSRSFEGVNRSLAGMVRLGAGLAAAFAVGALVNYGRSALEMASGLSEAAQRIGVTVEQLQIYRRAAEAAGASQEGLERSIGILNRTLGQARAGVPGAVQAFQALRIDPRQFATAGEALRTVIERLNEFRSDAEMAAIGQRLFGRGFTDLIPLVREGTAGLDAATAAAVRNGLITAEQAQKADEAADSLSELALTIQTQLGAALVDIMPSITLVVEGLALIARAAIWAITQIQNVLSLVDATFVRVVPRDEQPQFATIRNRDDAQRMANRTGQPVQFGDGPENIVRPARDGGAPQLNLRSGGGRHGGGGGANRGEDLARRREDLRLQQQLDVARARGDVEEERNVQRQIDLRRRVQEYKQAGLSTAVAEVAAGRDMADLQAARVTGLATEEDLEEKRMDLQAARISGDNQFIRLREDELFLAERIAYWRTQDKNLADATLRAETELAQMAGARAEAAERAATASRLDRDATLSQLRGDSDHVQRQYQRAAEMERRTRQLMNDQPQLNESRARERVALELDEEARASLQGDFRSTFRDGVRAALEGDFGGWFNRWWTEHLSKALEDSLNNVADLLTRLFQQAMGQGGKDGSGGLGGLGSIFSAVFGGGKSGGKAGGDTDYFGGALDSLSNLFGGAKAPGFDTGGSFEIGGKGGIDQNLVQFWGSKGEIVNIRRGPQDQGDGGKVTIVPSPYFDAVVQGQAAHVAAPMAAQAAQYGSADAQRSMYRRAGRQLP